MSMLTPETLESLLLDRALNHLSPEVLALLNAHLAQNPAAAAEAAAFSSTVSLATTALADAPTSAHPPLPTFRAPSDLRARQRRSLFRTIAAASGMAACLALGILVGQRPTPPAPTLADLPTPRITTPPAAEAPKPTDFWSPQRLQSLASKSAAAQPAPAPPIRPFLR